MGKTVKPLFALDPIMGRNIKDMRKKRGVNSEALASYLRLSVEELNMIEAGGGLTFRLVHETCSFLGCKISEIIPSWELEH